MLYTPRHISISIHRPAAEVYDFASDPMNLPRWAAGLSGSIRKVGTEWIADSPMGKVKVKFAERNTFGVLDHDVTLPDGRTVYNPMRAFPNHEGAEVVFTLYRLPGVSDESFATDAALVARDLESLKSLLESGRTSTTGAS